MTLLTHTCDSSALAAEFCNSNGIAQSAIQGIVCDSSGRYVVFYWG